MNALIIDENIKKRIKEIEFHAFNNVVPIRQLAESGKLKQGDPNPIQEYIENYELEIPVGFRVVFSVEEQGTPDESNLMRHLSMSVSGGNIPNPLSVDMVAQEFDIPPIYNCAIWIEKFEGSRLAINIVYPINGSFEKAFGVNMIEQMDRLREKNKNGRKQYKTEGGPIIKNVDDNS
jgi:hypothetical protein